VTLKGFIEYLHNKGSGYHYTKFAQWMYHTVSARDSHEKNIS